MKQLDEEVKTLNKQIEALVRAAAPDLVELHAVGVEIAGQFFVNAGNNAELIRNEIAFAKLCGVAPQPASSGRTTGSHRLSRGGDRAATSAFYIIAIVRRSHHQPARVPASLHNQYLGRTALKGASPADRVPNMRGQNT